MPLPVGAPQREIRAVMRADTPFPEQRGLGNQSRYSQDITQFYAGPGFTIEVDNIAQFRKTPSRPAQRFDTAYDSGAFPGNGPDLLFQVFQAWTADIVGNPNAGFRV